MSKLNIEDTNENTLPKIASLIKAANGGELIINKSNLCRKLGYKCINPSLFRRLALLEKAQYITINKINSSKLKISFGKDIDNALDITKINCDSNIVTPVNETKPDVNTLDANVCNANVQAVKNKKADKFVTVNGKQINYNKISAPHEKIDYSNIDFFMSVEKFKSMKQVGGRDTKHIIKRVLNLYSLFQSLAEDNQYDLVSFAKTAKKLEYKSKYTLQMDINKLIVDRKIDLINIGAGGPAFHYKIILLDISKINDSNNNNKSIVSESEINEFLKNEHSTNESSTKEAQEVKNAFSNKSEDLSGNISNILKNAEKNITIDETGESVREKLPDIDSVFDEVFVLIDKLKQKSKKDDETIHKLQVENEMLLSREHTWKDKAFALRIELGRDKR